MLVTIGNRSCGHQLMPIDGGALGGAITVTSPIGTGGGSIRAGRCRTVLLIAEASARRRLHRLRGRGRQAVRSRQLFQDVLLSLWRWSAAPQLLDAQVGVVVVVQSHRQGRAQLVQHPVDLTAGVVPVVLL